MMQPSSSRLSVKASSEAGFLSGQARRHHALDRQTRDRQAQIIARRLASLQTAAVHDNHHHDHDTATTSTTEPPYPSGSGSARRPVVLEIPEWLVDIPDDLYERWTVVARPEGQRCLAVSQYGRTTLRSVENRFVRACRTALPNGSPRSGSSSALTAVEGVIQDGTLFIIDIMIWKGYQLVHSPYQLRQYWLQAKAIDEDGVDRVDGEFDLLIRPLLSSRASPTAIAAAYRPYHHHHHHHGDSSLMGMVVDGILFHHDEALYVAGECTPLTLLWKDGICSQFHIEGVLNAAQQICLRCQPDNGALITEDNVVLGHMDPSTIATAVGTLQRFSIDGVDISSSHPVVIGMKYIGPCPASKVIAHNWSKILFQFGARRGSNLIRIDDLLGRMG